MPRKILGLGVTSCRFRVVFWCITWRRICTTRNMEMVSETSQCASQLSSPSRIFYINLPVCIPTMVAIYRLLNQKTIPEFSMRRIRAYDWTGVIFLTGSLTSLLYGITSGGVTSPWSSATVISTLAIGGAGIVVTMLYESLLAKTPMLPVRIFRPRTAALGYIITWCQDLALAVCAYFIPLYVNIPPSHN